MGFLGEILSSRKEEQLFRTLKREITGVDFCSNDYLGIAKNSISQVNLEGKLGATGSRLLSGNSNKIESLESRISLFHGTESALLFPSGYQANIGLLHCIATKNDTLILDELCHASLIDGARLSYAKRLKFSHNQMADLEKKIQNATGNVFVVVEGLYSMDGDLSPIRKIADICDRENAHLIVDEAHSAGIYGDKGKGWCNQNGVYPFAKIITYGKAFGGHGAAICGSRELKDYLVNFSRPFIYSTGIPEVQVNAIEHSYELVENGNVARKKLQENINYFRTQIKQQPYQYIFSETCIQGVIIGGNENTKKLADKLQENGLELFPILSPTVAKGTERIRICLHAYNTKEEIDQLIQVLNN